jgi:hypothetical protein
MSLPVIMRRIRVHSRITTQALRKTLCFYQLSWEEFGCTAYYSGTEEIFVSLPVIMRIRVHSLIPQAVRKSLCLYQLSWEEFGCTAVLLHGHWWKLCVFTSYHEKNSGARPYYLGTEEIFVSLPVIIRIRVHSLITQAVRKSLCLYQLSWEEFGCTVLLHQAVSKSLCLYQLSWEEFGCTVLLHMQ